LASSSRFSNRAIDCSTSLRVAADVALARARTPPPLPPERDAVLPPDRDAALPPERARVLPAERARVPPPERAVDLLADLRAAGIASPCWTG
jgi:hypothetical protein